MQLAGCAAPLNLAEYHRLDCPAQSESPRLKPQVFQDLASELRSGDVILGVKEDPITTAIRLISVEPSFFTHSGIIEVMTDTSGAKTIRVWHAMGDFSLLNRSTHVLGKVRGGVRTNSLEQFIAMYDSLAIMRVGSEAQGRAMVNSCLAYQKAEVEFDPFGDCLDPDAICCTELTALAMQSAGIAPDLRPAQRTSNVLLSSLLYGWNVTSSAFFVADQFERIEGTRTIAVLSKYSRIEMHLAMRDAAATIQERFNDGDVHLDQLVAFNAARMAHYQPAMELLLRGVEGLAEAEPTSDPAEIRRRNLIVMEEVGLARPDRLRADEISRESTVRAGE